MVCECVVCVVCGVLCVCVCVCACTHMYVIVYVCVCIAWVCTCACVHEWFMCLCTLIRNSTVCLQTYYCAPTINTEPVASQWQGVSKAIWPSRCQPLPHQSSTITHTTTWGVRTSTLGLSTNKLIFVFISNSSKVSHCVELFALLLHYLPIRWASVTAHVSLVYTQPFQWNNNLPHCDFILLLILRQINRSQPSVAAACIGQSSWTVIEVSKFQSVGKSWKSGTMYRTTECSLTEEQWTASSSDLTTSEIGASLYEWEPTCSVFKHNCTFV